VSDDVHLSVHFNEQEQLQWNALCLQMDEALNKIVAYLAAKSGCYDLASLPQNKIERLKAEASSLAEALDVVQTEEELDGLDDPAEDDWDEDDEQDGDDGDDEWDPDAAADKLANLDRDLLQLLRAGPGNLNRTISGVSA
jgi:hypothetical protein